MLNKSPNHDVIILDDNSSMVVQYKECPRPTGVSDIYREYAKISDLSIEETNITIAGFNARYFEWLDSREKLKPKQIQNTISNIDSTETKKETVTNQNIIHFESRKQYNTSPLKKNEVSHTNAEKYCPICGLPMYKRKNLSGEVFFWRCESNDRSHSIPVNESN